MSYLIHYNAVLKVKTPVFIGSGRKIPKSEYILLNGDTKIGIIDPVKIFILMQEKSLQGKYEDFLINNGKGAIRNFLRENGLNAGDIKDCIKYTIEAGDSFIDKNNKTEVCEFMLDPYGLPYVPGSSIKGMLRTVLLSYELMSDPEKYSSLGQTLSANSRMKASRNNYLRRDISDIEAAIFRTLERTKKHENDAVNDLLSGLIIGDSAPLSIKDLVVCRNVEYTKDGNEKFLPIARICLKPGTEIHFSITVDATVCKYKKNDIMAAVADFAKSFSDSFSLKFKGIKALPEDSVILGGGSGFVSKTVIYPLLGYDRGLRTTKNILNTIFTQRGVSHHEKDVELGISPHILKSTHYEGKTVEMGICSLSLE
jgi:CRISPR-associated protein Csm5